MHEREEEDETHEKRIRVFLLQPPQSSHPLGANFTLAAPFFATWCRRSCCFWGVYSKRQTILSAATKEPFRCATKYLSHSRDKSDFRAPNSHAAPLALSLCQPIHESRNKVNCNLLWNSAKNSQIDSHNDFPRGIETQIRRQSAQSLSPITKQRQSNYIMRRLKNEIAFRPPTWLL